MRERTVAMDRFRPLIIQALLLPLAAMILFAAVLLWQVSRVMSNQWWVDHTDQVIAKATALHAIHLRAESAVRGFLITKDSAFKDAFDGEVASMDPKSSALAELVADNPPQVQAINHIRQMREQWLGLIDRELQLRSSDGDWESILKSGVTRSLMQSINTSFQTFVGVEQGLRDQRTANVRRSFHIAIAVAISVAAAAGLTLALIARRQIRFLTGTYETALIEANAAADVLEQRVQKRTEELAIANAAMLRSGETLKVMNERLKISNRELQDFASVASHDLQEPLRKVQAFGDRLKVKSSSALGPEGLDYLERMLNAAGRMKNLINDLLTFARVSSRAQPFARVDLKHVAEQVISDLETRIEQKQATIQLGELPTIEADVTQMRQILQNLIGNALKFSKPGENPKVAITASEHSVDGESWVRLSIKDNGIGFDEKFLDRIFTVFQRLHGRNEYEGTGIGLAVCRKIAERHRGTITAQSRLGEGRTLL